MTIDIKQDIKEAVEEIIYPLLEKIERLEKNRVSIDDYRILKREEVAKYLNTTPEHIDRLARQGKINFIEIDGKRKYRQIDVLNYLKG